MRRLLLLAMLPLAACGAITKDMTAAGQGPGMYFCAGEGSISTVGRAGMFGGDANVTFNCNQGAYFGQGYPTGPLPVLPQSAKPAQINNFPPLGTPPTPIAP